MIKKIIKRLGIDQVILDVTNERRTKNSYSNSNAACATYHEEAQILNLQNSIDSIIIGASTHVRGELVVFPYGGKIQIGDYCYVGIGSRIWSGESIEIGNNVLISHGVNIIDTNSHELNHMERAEGFKHIITQGHPIEKGSILTAPISIHDHVWISFNAIILKGVAIGEGAIVTAGAVVTKDVPSWSVVAGNPAIVVGQNHLR